MADIFCNEKEKEQDEPTGAAEVISGLQFFG